MKEISMDSHDTLNLGSPSAPHQLTVVMNLSCRYCKKWWSRNLADVEQALRSGNLGLHIKFWTKDKSALRIGNIAHQFIDFSQPEIAFGFVKALINAQNNFKRCSVEQVPEYLEDNYGVTLHNSKQATEATTLALQEAGVRGIPTIVLDGTWHDSFHYRLPAL
ncbi:thioredoxin domain-containing protein [Nicoliella lavandulae]|uniref:Thioredoxin domain-containing protein n=1 Tax=Nicoliella lavandulae TaxID=3082954 RepID=A0ABU8SM35_9LACO